MRLPAIKRNVLEEKEKGGGRDNKAHIIGLRVDLWGVKAGRTNNVTPILELQNFTKMCHQVVVKYNSQSRN